ncbi:hypothetical protein PV10_04668 [Exophiala mesophila]|uniref:Zn(2)-C6 fungal-type domain-containing protein n=1 Tax=Exophiala mesophila TaxID=212818 RepID=A0A0D1XZ05_EXOME|nr:uncharacterized protein PV10_04668 [Exophiala mesophila]KIV93456.1 hypothetical protein PV10_04668 [Exophiala mesophila]
MSGKPDPQEATAENTSTNPTEPLPSADKTNPAESQTQSNPKSKNKNKEKDTSAASKRRCVSTACVACRKRKSKCDGNLPKCAACASVYMTECEYAPHTDHRRKGVYKKDVDASKAKNSTLHILIQAILNAEEDEVMDLVHQIRTCDSLEELAHAIENQETGAVEDSVPDSPIYGSDSGVAQFEAELSGKMGDLMLDGSVKFIGGTSNLIWLPPEYEPSLTAPPQNQIHSVVRPREEAVISWTTVTQDKELILHLINMYFCWHYAFFTTLAKQLFYRDFLTGTTSQYCSPLLVNVMLALGCHFSTRPAARANPDDSSTTGDHFFAEAKRLLYENDEFANAKLCTVQALALMSVREAGCGRESKGWVYSGMSFRMAGDLGLNVDVSPMNESSRLPEEDIDARRITFWGCFLFDKCWSNYLGRQPQLLPSNITVKKPDVFPTEDSEMWSPYTDSGIVQAHAQPARTRAVALQLSKLAEISSDLLTSFYNPAQLDKPLPKQTELKRLSDLHTRLEAWKQALPAELEPRDGQLPQALLMHMFFQLLYIHLYRPFLKYTRTTSPLPSHISPRKFCTQGAASISKLFRVYKRTYGLRQICNIAIYIVHSACTIHLLNLPEKNARRDIIHGIKHLEEMGECWTAARRTLAVLQVCAERWKIELPDEAAMIYTRARMKWGDSLAVNANVPSPQSQNIAQIMRVISSQPTQLTDLMARNIMLQQQQQQQQQQRQQQEQDWSNVPGKSAIPQQFAGISSALAPSPSGTVDRRRSSDGLSLPPTTAADLSRNLSKVRASTYLTQAQQDAWNTHTARMKSATASASGSGAAPARGGEAAKLFGGIDSLMEETQDWFFNDQNQLATGFENWGEGDSGDMGGDNRGWGTLDLDFFETDGPNGVNQQGNGNGSHETSNMATNENSPAYINGDMVYGYNGYTMNNTGAAGLDASGNSMGNGYTQQYPGYLKAGANGGGNKNPGGGYGGSSSVKPEYGYKRQHPLEDRAFEDDMYY